MGDGQSSVPGDQILCLNYNTGAWESSCSKKEISLLHLGSSTGRLPKRLLAPLLPCSSKDGQPSAGPRQTCSANRAGPFRQLWESLRPQRHGNLRWHWLSTPGPGSSHLGGRTQRINCSVSARISYKPLSFGLGYHLDSLGFMFPTIQMNIQPFSGLQLGRGFWLLGRWVDPQLEKSPGEEELPSLQWVNCGDDLEGIGVTLRWERLRPNSPSSKPNYRVWP